MLHREKMEKEHSALKAHVLVFPYPAQGHINPMLQFCKRLVSRGVKATLANTKYINKSMCADPNNLIDFETISDGFDEGGYAEAESSEAYLSTFKVVGSQTLTSLVKKLTDSSHPIGALIYDGFMPWALDIANQFGLPGTVFFTQSCAVNNLYYHVQQGLLPLPLSEPTVSLPGLPLLEFSETSSFISDFGSYPGFYKMVLNQFINIDEADWVLFASFYELEMEVYSDFGTFKFYFLGTMNIYFFKDLLTLWLFFS